MHLAPQIIDLAIILAVAGIMSFLFHKIRQPVVLGYIIAGLIIGPYTPPVQLVSDIPSIKTWAELGVIFLMFSLGLEFSFRKLFSLGGTALFTASFEVGLLLLLSYKIARSLGWSEMESLFCAAMMSISSTTIIIKALEELKLKTHKFAHLIFGILIVEDLFAILLLVALNTVASTQSFSLWSLLETTLNLIIVVGSWFIIGHYGVPRLISYIAKKGTNEMLTLVSIGLCLSLVVLATNFGYSAALGAFIMGSILAETKLIHQIEGLMAPLKDLFGAIFFVSIGMLIDPNIIWEYRGTIALLCAVLITGKIFFSSLALMLSGQSFKDSLQVGFGLAQIGEFSLIIAGLGVTLNATSNKLYSIAVAISLVTTFTTPYLIKASYPVGVKIEKSLPLWMKRILNFFVLWQERRQKSGEHPWAFKRITLKWIINALIVTVIFNNASKKISPAIADLGSLFKDQNLVFTWLLCIFLASPFIYSMLSTSNKRLAVIKSENRIIEATLALIFPFLTLIFLAIISLKYLSLINVLIALVILTLMIYFLLQKKLESTYLWIEHKIVNSIGQEKKEKISTLAPWDIHLYHFKIHPNAKLANLTLSEAHVRNRLGINVIAIRRGEKTLVAPHTSERIMPMDTLIVLGTDEQLDLFRTEAEEPVVQDLNNLDVDNYALESFVLHSSSPMLGKSIQELNLREKYQALLVGIERQNHRLLNPPPDFRFQDRDILWIVGDKQALMEALAELS